MSLDQEVELMRRIPIFKKIDTAMLKLLCFSSDRLMYEPNQIIYQADDVGDAAYVLIEGRVDITVPRSGGDIKLQTLGPNEIFGEIAIFADVRRTATVTAITAVEALRIAKEQFLPVIRQNPDAAMELIRILALRLANTTAKLSGS